MGSAVCGRSALGAVVFLGESLSLRLVLASAAIGGIGRDWRILEARLVPSASCAESTIAIEFRGPGILWIDRVSLIPEDVAPAAGGPTWSPLSGT